MKLLIFADFHYKKRMYASTPGDLGAILRRAHESGAELILHMGDFSNDYARSPEVTRLLLDNPYGLPVYGLYGNHEMESKGNTMAVVTPMLTNDPAVVWGTPSCRIGDGSVAYYCFDRGLFRFVMTDTNYSLAPDGTWEHNREASWGPPKENARPNSLGPAQLAWLERVLTECAGAGRKAVVCSHAAFSARRPSSDAEPVRAIFARVNALRPKTVLMAVNGHEHTNHIDLADGILYFDVNTVRNAFWKVTPDFHYADGDGFAFTDFDEAGAPLGTSFLPYNELKQAKNTWFSRDPLSAVVTLEGDGTVVIEGAKSEWVCGVVPDTMRDGKMPEISDYSGKL